MPYDPNTRDLNHVRREDRAVHDESWIRDRLRRTAIGSLATVHDGQPFINSNFYVYDEAENAIYTHTSRYGRTRTNLDTKERVCFSISDMGRLLPAPEALEFSVEYSGVIVFGRGQVVEGEQAHRGLQMLLDKYFPHLTPDVDYRGITPDELARTSVYRIAIESWSAKQKQVAPDFPGAFFYPYTPPASDDA